MDLNEALLDPYFYFKLKLDKYQTYKDLNGITCFGLDINQFHQLEIFIDGQKKQKFNYNDLNSESVLFSLHEIRKKSINTSDNLINAYHLFAKEKGLTYYIFFDEELDFLPTKISNNENATKYFLKIVQNPSKFYDSLDYNKKRKFQYLVFPEGFHYSIQNRKYRTSKTNALFELTKCISDSCDSEKQKTHPQKWDGSSLVAGTGLEPVTFGL